MALWGKLDGVVMTGTASITEGNTAVVGVGTLFTEEFKTGYVIELDDTRFRVKAVTDDENMTVFPVALATLSAQDVVISQAPRNLSDDVALGDAVLVMPYEASESAFRDIGLKTPGWSTYSTYTAADGSTRRRSESLISMKVNPEIIFLVQPEDTTAVADAAAFDVVVRITGRDLTPTYQWQIFDDGDWADIDDIATVADLDFSGTDTDTLTIDTTAGAAGDYEFRVAVSNDEAGTAFSQEATLTVPE
jgi:hypothetical protein